jgi:hypothetical protein
MSNMSAMTPRPTVEDAASRRYLVILLGAILAIAMSLAGFAVWLAPPSGDLVRIGGWSERNYGWHGTKRGFMENYYQETTLSELLEGGPTGDILVFGDSFSAMHPHNITWINTLHEQTGWSVKLLPLKGRAGMPWPLDGFVPVVRYLDSDAFQAAPPAAINVQSVERATVERAMAIYEPALSCEVQNTPITQVSTSAAPVGLPQDDFSRRTQFDSFDEMFSRGALALRTRLKGSSDSIPIQFNRNDLFSNRATRQGLIYIDDIHLYTADAFPQNDPESAGEKALCGLRQMIARGGSVPMRFMIAPDKRSIYDGWITTSLPTKEINVFALAHQALGASFIDLLAPLTEAADTNQDVYYPNDTHWGPIGHRIAGMNAAASLR